MARCASEVVDVVVVAVVVTGLPLLCALFSSPEKDELGVDSEVADADGEEDGDRGALFGDCKDVGEAGC